MSLRSTLRRAAGLLVEMPPESEIADTEDGGNRVYAQEEVKKVYDSFDVDTQPPTKTVAQIVHDSDGPNLDQIQIAPHAVPAAMNPDGSLNFDSIYQAASLPPVPFTAEQVLALFSSLPESLPLEVKRQTVAVSINAMGKAIGASPENIVADASRKLAALAAYTDHLTKETTELRDKAELEIVALEAQIEDKRKAVEEAQQKLTHDTQACSEQSDRLDDVLEFFSLDVPPSKYAPS